MWLEIFLFVLVFYFLREYFKADVHVTKLSADLPGPKAYPIIGNLYDMPRNGADGLRKRVQMIKDHGHVCRVWMANTLIVLLSDPKDAESVLNNTVDIDKSAQYTFLHPWLGTGLLTSSGDKWHIRRKAITPTFHFKILEQFIDVFNKQGGTLYEVLRTQEGKGHFDIQPFISRYALDVICETAMGTKINAQNNSTSAYVAAVRRICEVIYKRMNQPWLRYPFIFSLLGYQAKQEEDLKVLHGMTNKVIEEKRKLLENKSIANGFSEDDIGVKRKTAFLELLLGMMANASKTFISTQDIREEVDTFMFEGHDTTTSSLCYTLHLLSKHRDVQDKVYKEIEAAGLTEKDPSYTDLQELKYLERVIKESLRLYPAVPIVARHLSRDLTINSGYTLPKGCIVGVSAYFIHRNEEHYNNPEEFNPDNFLPEPAATRHPYAYVPFSAGPRNCIGQKFAMLELKATVVKVLKNFVLEDAGREWDPEPNPTLILQSVNGFHLGLTHR